MVKIWVSSPVMVSGADCKSVVFGLLSSNLRAPTKIWPVDIMVIMPACLVGQRSSILLQVAKYTAINFVEDV